LRNKMYVDKKNCNMSPKVKKAKESEFQRYLSNFVSAIFVFNRNISQSLAKNYNYFLSL
jgi:hypothetical protein